MRHGAQRRSKVDCPRCGLSACAPAEWNAELEGDYTYARSGLSTGGVLPLGGGH